MQTISEKASKDLHKFIAKLLIKHSKKIAEMDKSKEVSA